MTLAETAAAVRSGALRAVEVVDQALRRIERIDPAVHAFESIDAERALERARLVDARIAAGDDPGPLAGVTVAVKDVHDAAGSVTGHGSRAFLGARPATNDCELVVRLEGTGAIIVGRTTTSELEFSATSASPVHGVTEHPMVAGHTPGGSSGGSAAAVALDMVTLATGTDGGGSLRCPAACCALPALKLSLGRMPRVDGEGRLPAWSTLSVSGLLTRDFDSLLVAHDAVAGPDARDPNSQPAFSRPLTELAAEGRTGPGPRLAWAADLGWTEPAPDVVDVCRAAVEQLAAAGARVGEAAAIADRDPAPVWTRIAATGTVAWLRERLTPGQWDELDPRLHDLLRRWGEGPLADVVQAWRDASELARGLARVLDGADALVCPTTAKTAPEHAAAYRTDWVRNTYVFNLTGSAAATLPVGVDAKGLPIGLQLVVPAGEDERLVRIAAWAHEVLGSGVP